MSIGRTGAKPTVGSGGTEYLRSARGRGLGGWGLRLGRGAALGALAAWLATTTVVAQGQPGNSEQNRTYFPSCSCD